MKFAIIVPTLNAGLVWIDWIDALLATRVYAGDVYIIDSGSSDNTVQMSSAAGFNVKQIERSSFNHGATRQSVLLNIDNYDIAIFLTQDAILARPDSIKNILAPFQGKNISAVCGRQLPKLGAKVQEYSITLRNHL